MSEYLIKEIINDDGIPFNPPENPLLKKYPPKCSMGISYSCMYCGDCPHGEYFKIPEEDMAEYLKWHEEHEAYIRDHNPEMMAWLNEHEEKEKEKEK